MCHTIRACFDIERGVAEGAMVIGDVVMKSERGDWTITGQRGFSQILYVVERRRDPDALSQNQASAAVFEVQAR